MQAHASSRRAPVEELGAEVLLELLVDEGLDAIVGGILLVGVQLETQAAAALLNHAAAHVTGHDDQRVLEIHRAALHSIRICISPSQVTRGQGF